LGLGKLVPEYKTTYLPAFTPSSRTLRVGKIESLLSADLKYRVYLGRKMAKHDKLRRDN